MIKKGYYVECDKCGTVISHCDVRRQTILYESKEEAYYDAMKFGFVEKDGKLYCYNCSRKGEKQ